MRRRRRIVATLVTMVVLVSCPAVARRPGIRPTSPRPRAAAAALETVRQLVAANRLPEALAACEAALHAGESDGEMRRVHADLLAWTGRPELAVAEYDSLLRARPRDRSLRVARAFALEWQGELRAAAREFEILAREAADASVTEELERLRRSPELALADARAAVAATPGDAEAVESLVRMLADHEQYWEAEETIARARSFVPDDERLAALAGDLRARKTRWLEARVARRAAGLKTAADGDPERVADAEDLAALGRLAQAADQYARFTRAHPERRDLRLQEARIRSWRGDYRRSLALYETLVREQPDDGATLLEMARVLAWDGQLAHAAGELDRVAGESDVVAAARGVRADVDRWDGAPARAAAGYRAALAAGLDGDAAREARAFLAQEATFTDAGARFTYFDDSDDFRAVRGGAFVTRQTGFATRIGAQTTHADYQQLGRGLSAERGSFSVDQDWRLLRARIGAGAGGYSTGEVRPAATAQVELAPRPEEALGVGYDRYDLIDEVSTLASARPDVLQGDRGRAWLRTPVGLGLRLAAQGSLTGVSDGNRLHVAGASLARRVLRRPRIDLLVDARTYGAAERSARYWSPRRYWTTGLTVSIAQRLWWGFELRLDGRGGYANEDGTAVPEMSWGVDLGRDVARGWRFAVGYHAGESARSGGYQSQIGTAELTYRFGATGP